MGDFTHENTEIRVEFEPSEDAWVVLVNDEPLRSTYPSSQGAVTLKVRLNEALEQGDLGWGELEDIADGWE